MPTFGKKGRRPDTGRRGRRLVEAWPPEWKPLEECPQAKLGIIDPKIYDLDLNQYNPLDKARIFIQQLRDSRGYDLEFNPPKGRVVGNLYLLPPHFWKTDPQYIRKVEFVTHEINAQAMKHNEQYELVEVVRFVQAMPHHCDFFTFNVRQVLPEDHHHVLKTVQAMVQYVGVGNFKLLEWRFRPGPPLTLPEGAPIYSSSSDVSPIYSSSSDVSPCLTQVSSLHP